MDIRMVMNQDPERMIDAVRSHLDRHGFTDVTMVVQNVMKPSRTPYSNGFVPITVDAVRAASGDEPIVYSVMGGRWVVAFPSISLPMRSASLTSGALTPTGISKTMVRTKTWT